MFDVQLFDFEFRLRAFDWPPIALEHQSNLKLQSDDGLAK